LNLARITSISSSERIAGLTPVERALMYWRAKHSVSLASHSAFRRLAPWQIMPWLPSRQLRRDPSASSMLSDSSWVPNVAYLEHLISLPPAAATM